LGNIQKASRTNSTFGFLPTRKKANPKKPKELFFSQRSDRKRNRKSNFTN
jgi:hypothetical protein